MNDYIQREIDARVKAEMEARSLLDRAAEENRDLSPEEDEQFNRWVAESDKRKERIAKLEKMAEAEAVKAEVRHVVEAATATAPAQSIDEQLAATIRGMFHGESGERVFEMQPGKAPYETRALETSTATVPTDLANRIAVYARTLSPWLGLATVINGSTGAPLILPNLTADPTSYTPGQGTAITPADPTIGSVTATPVSYKALTLISQELAEDEVVQLMDAIARSQGRSLGLAFGAAATTAILSAATNGGTATGLGGGGTATFFGLDDFISLMYSAAAEYRMSGSWVMANGAIQKARKFVDTNGQYLWQPAVALGQPDILLGRPVYEDPSLATPASATKSVIFGDASAYVIKQLPIRVAVSSEYAFNTDQVAVKSVFRVGGALPVATALRYLVSANS